MNLNTVFVRKQDGKSLTPDFEEVYKYLGYLLKDRKGSDDEVDKLVHEVCSDFSLIIQPQSVYLCVPLKIEGENLTFADRTIVSKDLSRYLKGCTYVYLFAATLGPAVDRQIQRAQRIDPSRSVVMQAAGAMYIEKYCDVLCDYLKEESALNNMETKHRYSPGFGDVSLEVQKIFFELLKCSKIGLTLMDTLIMAPEKSVTAFVGVKEK